jgi:outer membrane receptor protein involved in Fe transport
MKLEARKLIMGAMVFLSMFLALAGGAAVAQSDGAVEGAVTAAADGARLPGVEVRALHIASGQEFRAFSDGEGSYAIDGLPTGGFRLTATLDGFADRAVSVTVKAGGTVTVDFSLILGTIEDKLTITSSKGERAVEEIPAQITVVTATEIEDRQIVSPQRAIERAPNVRSIDTNPARARPQYRGLSSSRILLLVDGERLNNVRFDAGATGISPGMVDVTQLDAVEVVGGAGSSLYGTDAMAGVVNLITKDANRPMGGKDMSVRLDALYDENSDYYKGVVNVDYSSPKFSMRASVSQFELDGWNAGDEGVTKEQVVEVASFANAVAQSQGSVIAESFAIWELPEGGFVPNGQGEGNNYALDLRWFPSNKHNFRLKTWASEHENLGLPFSTPPYDSFIRFNSFRDFIRYTAEYEMLGVADWLPRIAIRYYHQKFERPQDDLRFSIDRGSSWDFAPDGGSVFTGELSTFTRGREQSTLNEVTSDSVSAQFNIALSEQALVTTGFSWLEDSSEDNFRFQSFDPAGNVIAEADGLATTPDTTYENIAWFGVLEWSPAPWVRVSGGVRWDEWETQADPTAGYPPGGEGYLVTASLPQILVNPGDVNLAGLEGAAELATGTSSIGTKNDVWTGNIGLIFPTEAGVSPFIRWGESYREPEVTVRYLIRNFGSPFFSVSGLPNTALQPEEGETLDWGIKLVRERFRGSLTFFENELENFIETNLSQTYFIPARPDLGLLPTFSIPGVGDFHGVLFFQRDNVAQAEIDGFELTFEASLPWGARGSFTPFLMYGETEGSNKTPAGGDVAIVEEWYGRSDTLIPLEGSVNDVPFGETPEAAGLVGLRYSSASGNWFAEYEMRWVDDIKRVPPGTLGDPNLTQFGPITSLEGYEKHSIRGSYTFGGNVPIKLTLGVENLTDDFYFEPFQPGPASGRTFILGASFRWENLLSK